MILNQLAPHAPLKLDTLYFLDEELYHVAHVSLYNRVKISVWDESVCVYVEMWIRRERRERKEDVQVLRVDNE